MAQNGGKVSHAFNKSYICVDYRIQLSLCYSASVSRGVARLAPP